MVERGHKIPVHEWWLRLARSLMNNDPRDYTQLSRFSLGQSGVTLELAEALCKEYSRLPPPVVFPRSYEEAVHIVGVAERYGTTIEAPNEGDVISMPPPSVRRSRRRGSTVEHVETQTAPATRRRAR